MRIEEDRAADGVRHRGFTVVSNGRAVPGALWTPLGPSHLDGAAVEPGEPFPLVLIGHGASGSRYQDYVRTLGRSLAADFGIAAVAIDGPVHGARRPDGGGDGHHAFLDFATAWSSDTQMTDTMIEDWQHTLDAVLEFDDVVGPVAYWGLSMGTILGLPLVAAEPRISAAVLGLMGMTGPTVERIRKDAAQITCPVLFIVQWDDELFHRQTAFELFDALGSTDKTMHANPGHHGAVPDHEFAASARYLARRLARSASGRRL
ncbi:MAG: dienelactone hydrolase family protein [Acidimicrobiales bacterium]